MVDRYAKLIAYKELDEVLTNVESELVYKDEKNYNYIYKINKFLPYPKFTEADITEVNKDNYNMKDDYKYIRGIYDYESIGDLRWSMKNSSILIKNNSNANNTKLNISYQIRAYEQFIDKEPVLKIFVNDTEVYSKVVNRDEIYNENIELKDILKSGEVAQIKFQFSTRVDAKNDGRELSFVLRSASLAK